MRNLCLLAALLLAAEARGQTIQLPSFHSIGVNTSVIVPDSGGAYIARDRQITDGYSTFGGIPRNQGWGIRRGASSVGVTAQIHDPQASDAALLGSHDRRAAERVPTLRTGAGIAAAEAPAASLSELARRRAAQATAGQREALALLEKGRTAQAEGKPSVATIYYRSAARAATGELRQQIVDEFNALAKTEGGSRTSRVRGAGM